MVLVACASSPDAGDGPSATSGVERKVIPMQRPAEIDILFVIDSTAAMAPYRDDLRVNLRRFAEDMAPPLQLHVGVVTADPADVALRTTTALDGNFVSDTVGDDGRRVRNYQGDLGSVLAELGDVGTAGATSSPLVAAQTAIAAPGGFFRDKANTALLIITANDADGPLADIAAQFRALESDPSRFFLGAVHGAGQQLPAILEMFPNRNAQALVTDDDWSSLTARLRNFHSTLEAHCFDAPLFDTDPDAAGIQPECAAWYEFPIGGDALPACAAAPDRECWRFAVDGAGCTGQAHPFKVDHQRLDFPREAKLVVECLTTTQPR